MGCPSCSFFNTVDIKNENKLIGHWAAVFLCQNRTHGELKECKILPFMLMEYNNTNIV